MQPYFEQFAPISSGCAMVSWLWLQILAEKYSNAFDLLIKVSARQQIPTKC